MKNGHPACTNATPGPSICQERHAAEQGMGRSYLKGFGEKMKRILDPGTAPRPAVFNDLPTDILSMVTRFSLSPRWVDDERANLRQLLDYSLVSRAFRNGVAQARRDLELINFRRSAARKDYVAWGHKPGMHDKMVMKRGVNAVPRQHFGDFPLLPDLPPALKKVTHGVDRDKGIIRLSHTELDLKEFTTLLDTLGSADVTRLILEESVIAPKSAQENLGEFTGIQATFLALHEVRHRLANLEEFHFQLSHIDKLPDKFFLGQSGEQLGNAVSRFLAV
jgi:hypothetical protein